MTLVIYGKMFTNVSRMILMFFACFTILKTLIILKALITVAAVEKFMLLLMKLLIIPKFVPITITKSNLFHD